MENAWEIIHYSIYTYLKETFSDMCWEAGYGGSPATPDDRIPQMRVFFRRPLCAYSRLEFVDECVSLWANGQYIGRIELDEPNSLNQIETFVQRQLPLASSLEAERE